MTFWLSSLCCMNNNKNGEKERAGYLVCPNEGFWTHLQKNHISSSSIIQQRHLKEQFRNTEGVSRDVWVKESYCLAHKFLSVFFFFFFEGVGEGALSPPSINIKQNLIRVKLEETFHLTKQSIWLLVCISLHFHFGLDLGYSYWFHEDGKLINHAPERKQKRLSNTFREDCQLWTDSDIQYCVHIDDIKLHLANTRGRGLQESPNNEH